MPIVHNPDSTYSREVARWNLTKREGGFNADGFEAFPTMLYKAFPNPQGKVMCGDPRAAMGDAEAETFSRKCQLFIQDQEALDRATRAGWYPSPDAAIAGYESDERNVADAAAARHFSDQRMSAAAQAEADAADAATHAHVAAVPVRRKRGRPTKPSATAKAVTNGAGE
jgi:hypothetical protein